MIEDWSPLWGPSMVMNMDLFYPHLKWISSRMKSPASQPCMSNTDNISHAFGLRIKSDGAGGG
ncbi:MAG: hypothetical protein U0X87_11890 [Anaerolineales bacterium]